MIIHQENPIAFLHIDPAFNQLRRLVHQNPAHLPSLLQHLASSNPDLVQLINDNQEDFYHLINAPSVAAMPQGPPPGAQGLQLSPEDAEAIERLVAFGFDRATAAQAYFACDKDENAAANWLFEHGNE
ncbi:hypothetical protein PTSG_04717 [Salpingoeca rosetta]|uniref:UV excision repair protein RAD23 n=1 Tax=Salpingoeca rosetta (strain ATCC 50818 / BSB-021) TaxID=946362 RepID=F2U9I1_SALR5|nr:uncharacterized protein PTSG_04717 [Salpingoeca rosetta]EGD73008.1 hypothetical protein PTSG_04717 [Salpingoeca rosetta]|eukprot:XP_004994039.1 hypothetical protein PTSG_04717 [Salpingoeca rosetta]